MIDNVKHMSELALSNTNGLLDLDDTLTEKVNVIDIVYITDRIHHRLPTFNQEQKLLTLYAEKYIKLRRKEYVTYCTEDQVLLTKYLYNFSTSSDFLLRHGIKVQASFIGSRQKERLSISFHNYTNFQQTIYADTELLSIRFVTHSFINFKIKSDLDYRFYKNDRAPIAKTDETQSSSSNSKR